MKKKLTHIVTILLLTTSLSYSSQKVGKTSLNPWREQASNETDQQSPPGKLNEAQVLQLLEKAINNDDTEQVRTILNQNPDIIDKIANNRNPNSNDTIKNGIFTKNKDIAILLANAGFLSAEYLTDVSNKNRTALTEYGASLAKGLTDNDLLIGVNEALNADFKGISDLLLTAGPMFLNFDALKKENPGLPQEQLQQLFTVNNLLFTNLIKIAQEKKQTDLLKSLKERGFNINQ